MEPRYFDEYIDIHLTWMREKNYSGNYIIQRKGSLKWFVSWCTEQDIFTPKDVTRRLLERYQTHVLQMTNKRVEGKPLDASSRRTYLNNLQEFFKWLAKREYIDNDPAALAIELPKRESRLPKTILSHDEVEQILNAIDVNKALGIRARAIIETLYSTGIRASELCNIKYSDLNDSWGTVIIRQGKGKKDRMVPIGERALAWIQKYTDDVRPRLAMNSMEDPDDFIFLSAEGAVITKRHLGRVVRDSIKAANIGKKGACHLFRHTMATVLLENGADVRYIQAMLGHASLRTTEIYTRVMIQKVKDVHTACHPARLSR